jgi:hypothetical protein
MAASTAEYLGELVLKLIGMNASRKREVAEYMFNIAETLGKFAPKLREGASQDELWGLAKETEDLAKRFAKATSDVLPEKEQQAHISRLEKAFNAKNMLTTGTIEQRDQLLLSIAEAAGAFRSAAASLKGSAGKFG